MKRVLTFFVVMSLSLTSILYGKEEKKPPSIESFTEKASSVKEGMTTVYQIDGRYYLNINDSLLGREIIMVTRIAKGAEGVRSMFDGYAGDQINSALFTFDRGPDNKIFLRKTHNKERSRDSTQAMFSSLARSNVAAILATFEIKALSEESGDNLIDVTDLFSGDASFLYFSKSFKTRLKLGGMVRESSYIVDISTYPINSEVRSVKTFSRSDNGENATFELNCSFVLLPKKPMVPRYADSRVGYFTTGYTDFDKNPQGIKDIKMITRWRLEPKEEDIEKYMRGELVEPAKPIIFYIDPTTPEEWVPYLIEGVNDWAAVFEKAGFKNAIMGKRAPTKEEDPEWSLEDARYSAIVYKPSAVANASGPHVADPRSGEIIESHINWYHNVMSLLRNWYFVQCSPVDPAARNLVFDSELMGQLVRFVSSHEVGHTLGLRHNFGGTSLYSVEQLRDPQFLRENGHTTSIMDYSRFNYVVQPGDNIPRELLFPRIGHYDEWAIEWGYRRFYNYTTPEEELTHINRWVIEKTKDRRYWFGTESDVNDPRNQAEDLGSNQMEANELGIKNLKYIMDHLGEWTAVPNGGFEELRSMHGEVANQFYRYIGHVAKWVGGIYREPKTVEQEGVVFTHVEKEKQVEAMRFLERNLFVNPPLWLVPDHYLNKFPSKSEVFLERSYSRALNSLLSRRVIMNLTDAERELGRDAFRLEDLFTHLNKAIWGELGEPTSFEKRVLQKVYVTTLVDLYTGALSSGPAPKKPTTNPKDLTECSGVAYSELIGLLDKLKGSLKKGAVKRDYITHTHLNYLVRRIEKSLSSDVI